MGEHVTEEEQFTLRSELGKLMRTARIARPGALYDAHVYAQISETTDETISNTSDFEESGDVNSTKSTGYIKHNLIQGFDEFASMFPKIVNRSNLLKKSKMVRKSKTHFQGRNYLHMRYAIWKLKSGGEITIRFPIADWGGNEVAAEARCGAWGHFNHRRV